MIRALDSAQPPTRDQALAARAAGVGGWWGYLGTQGQGGSALGLLHVWTRQDFQVVQDVFGGPPVGFCSGWDDPAAVAALGASWGVRPCLDVEAGIRPTGGWVQPWLDASGAGVYGACGTHSWGPRAAFHVLAWYPGGAPEATWYDKMCARPGGPVGWQSVGSHDEFGLDVDSGWYDDWFGGEMLTQDDINAIAAASAAAVGGVLFGFTPDTATYLTKITQEVVNGTAQSPSGMTAQLAAILAAVKAIPVAGGLTAAQAQELTDLAAAAARIEAALRQA